MATTRTIIRHHAQTEGPPLGFKKSRGELKKGGKALFLFESPVAGVLLIFCSSFKTTYKC